MKAFANPHVKNSVKASAGDALARVIIPIVEGQLRSYMNDHPSHFAAVRGLTNKQIIASIAKRIINDLLCGSTTARLTAALMLVEAAEEASVCGCLCSRSGRGDSGCSVHQPILASPPDKGQTE